MTNILQRLFGGSNTVQETAEPVPGIGGYTQGAGPTGASGFPGSTSSTRVFKNASPRSIGIRSDTNTGTQPVTQTRHDMQNNSDAEFYGGPMLKTGPGNNTAGAHPLSPAQHAGGHSMLDTTTPFSRAPFTYQENVPGSANVRNEISQRYKNKPGDLHTYKSASRPDQAYKLVKGQNADGSVNPSQVSQDVTVPSRSLFQNQGWYVDREMPYGGRGNGARGADLNGQRYYAPNRDQDFMNAGMGNYGIARERGGDYKRTVSYNQPAPWSVNVYDQQVTSDAQQPSAAYTSPSFRGANNRTQRG